MVKTRRYRPEVSTEIPQVRVIIPVESKNDVINDTTLPKKDLFRIDEVASYFSVTDRTIRLWIEHGHLGAKKISGVVRIPRESILECGEWFTPKIT